jgi:lipoate-protein ligase A
MPTLGFMVEPCATPPASRSVERAMLATAVARGRGTVRISRLVGDVVALGRWHLAPAGDPGVELHRRLTGGRAAAAGTGFVSLALALPHRSALVSDDPLALAPEQVLNRAVRGLLGALEATGLPAVYPGRDQVTVGGRPIAVLGLEVDATGATLIEAILSVERDQSVLPGWLDRADPDGRVVTAMTLPDDVTSIARALGRIPAFDEVVAWIRAGFTARLDAELVPEPLPPVEADDGSFVTSRRPRAALARRARAATMLGVLEAHCALDEAGLLREVMLAGDLMAPSSTLPRLEAALRGCPPVVERVAAIVAEVVHPPRDFVLGVHPLTTIADTVVRAVS